MNKKLLIVLPLVSIIMFSGCATYYGGGAKQKITINSSKPMKASLRHISIKNKTMIDELLSTKLREESEETQSFTTPATITIFRKNKNLLLTSDDNEFEPIIIKKRINPWFFGDVLAISFTTIDSYTGAMWKYDDNIIIPVNNDTTTLIDDNITAPENDDTPTPVDDNITTPENDDTPTPVDDNITTPENDDTPTPVDDNITTPENDDTPTPVDDNITTPENDDTPTPVDDNITTPENDDTPTPVDDNITTP